MVEHLSVGHHRYHLSGYIQPLVLTSLSTASCAGGVGRARFLRHLRGPVHRFDLVKHLPAIHDLIHAAPSRCCGSFPSPTCAGFVSTDHVAARQRWWRRAQQLPQRVGGPVHRRDGAAAGDALDLLPGAGNQVQVGFCCEGVFVSPGRWTALHFEWFGACAQGCYLAAEGIQVPGI